MTTSPDDIPTDRIPLERNPDGSPRSAAEIEADIARTRERLGRTLDELEHRLAPKQLLEQGIDMIRDSFSGDRSLLPTGLGETIRSNPIPLALIGIGVGWLLMSNTGASERLSEAAGSAGRRVGRSARAAARSVSDAAGSAIDQAGEIGTAAANRLRSAVGAAASPTTGGMAQADLAYARSKYPGSGQSPTVASSAPLSGTGTPFEGHRTADAVAEFGDAAQARAESYARQAADAARSFGDRIVDLVDQYPLAAGGLAALAGTILAVSLPSTRPEDELVGGARDDLRDELVEEGRDTLERVQKVAERAAIAAADAAKEAARDEAEKQKLTPATSTSEPVKESV